MCAVAPALRLTTTAPYDGAAVLRWLGARLVPGVEELDGGGAGLRGLGARLVPGVEELAGGGVYRRTLRLPGGPAVAALALDGADGVHAQLRLGDSADEPAALAACRALLDLDARPDAYNAV